MNNTNKINQDIEDLTNKSNHIMQDSYIALSNNLQNSLRIIKDDREKQKAEKLTQEWEKITSELLSLYKSSTREFISRNYRVISYLEKMCPSTTLKLPTDIQGE